jgi:hypothetical protein
MQCPTCRTDNCAGRRFCAACGASLILRCAVCGFANEAGEQSIPGRKSYQALGELYERQAEVLFTATPS